MLKKLVLLLALCAMLFQQQVAQAQLAPVFAEAFTGTINEVIASAVESNLARRGIVVAANDASMVATESYIGTAANAASYASTALTTVAAIAGAPVWLTVALGVGALAAVGGAAWGIYTLTQNNGLGGTTADGSVMPQSLSLSPVGGAVQPASPAGSGVWTTYILPNCFGFTVCSTGTVMAMRCIRRM